MDNPQEIILYWDMYVGELLLAEDVEVRCHVHNAQLNPPERDVGIFEPWWEFGEVEPINLLGKVSHRYIEEPFPEVLKPLFQEWVKNEDELVAEAMKEQLGE